MMWKNAMFNKVHLRHKFIDMAGVLLCPSSFAIIELTYQPFQLVSSVLVIVFLQFTYQT